MAKPFTPDTLADRWECSRASSATWPPAERQTNSGGSMGCVGDVKPQCRYCLRNEVQADGWCRKCGNHAGVKPMEGC